MYDTIILNYSTHNYQTASEGDMDEKEPLLTNKVSLNLVFYSHLH